MAPSEAERFDLREGLSDVLPEGAVVTLMDSLPPMGWSEFATKTDLAALEERMDTKIAKLDTKIEVLRTNLETKIARLDTKIDSGLKDLDTKIAKLDTKIEGVDARLTEMRGETKLDIARQTYMILAGVAAALAAAMTPVYIALFAGFGG